MLARDPLRAARPLTVAAAIALAIFGASPSARAQSASPEAKAKAQQEFNEGQKAFRDGDFRHAAESFEAAFRDVPHPASLWNAARAWHRADEKARAANLYSKYLRLAPPKARDRNSATDALKQLSTQLARLEIHAVDMTDVRVDREPVEDLTVYVTPGAHVIEARQGDKTARESQTVSAGAVVSVALVPSTSETPVTAPPPPPPPPPPPESKGGLSPWFVAAGGAVTAAGLGLTIWSGLDTVNQKKAFDEHPSQEALDSGNAKQTRTNVFLGATIGVAALTGVCAVFLVDWGKSKDDPKVGIGPNRVTFRMTF